MARVGQVQASGSSGAGVPSAVEARVTSVLKAICLVGFPLILIVIDLSGIHPRVDGSTGAEQIASVAASSARWAQVHAAFTVAGFMALGTILVLGDLSSRGPSRLPSVAAAAIGAVGAVLFTGTVIMEVLVVPKLAAACAEARPCLSPANLIFTEELADQGWRVLPGLVLGGQGIALGLLLLAVLGARSGGLAMWEAVLLGAGGFYELIAPTGLHRWGTFGVEAGLPAISGLMVLAANSGIALRLLRGRTQQKGEPSAAQLPAEDLVNTELGSLEVDDRTAHE